MLSFMDHVRLTDTRPDAKVSRNLENRYVGWIVSNCASLATFPDGERSAKTYGQTCGPREVPEAPR
jgi:hypothetical protein